MEKLSFSFIIPVFNRPHEVEELLECFTKIPGAYEIVIVEDGSVKTSEHVVRAYEERLNIAYYFKPNTGPGDSRNYGMRKAQGNYFIILDSDVLLPTNYLEEVKTFLTHNYVDCYGGPDASHPSFTNLQKAISFAMTSFITTGGIRGQKKQVNKFQPRSFNMGISKKAFLASEGFGSIHPGEDPDLSLRLVKLGFATALIPNAIVFHKRRISWSKFYTQVNKFGLVRPILNTWHPNSASLVYWFPTMFILGLVVAILLALLNITMLFFYIYAIYFSLAFAVALIESRSLGVAMQAIIAIVVQFFGYGYGFLKSSFYISLLRKKPEHQFPQLFFDTK
ncbi:glycosyltransferase [Winogradskyella alexanderae]|uniref:Glycosyltransferase n=1 Tax=Winogradskyella alexanderae TaxID=2877123 RepID=A0ABS7XSU0_9FLAO|nr:glycosyltransferase [Winogradskyella alexanderae]MCA0133082.1 glycosyltransferase [Winogradskyella alexanderae]